MKEMSGRSAQQKKMLKESAEAAEHDVSGYQSEKKNEAGQENEEKNKMC